MLDKLRQSRGWIDTTLCLDVSSVPEFAYKAVSRIILELILPTQFNEFVECSFAFVIAFVAMCSLQKGYD